MRLSRQWLNEITPVRKTDTQVADIFTQLGFECEHVESVGSGLENVVTAKILNIRQHPNADKLQLATVTDGSKSFEVVCGAPNIAIGQIVPLARIGVTLPNGQKIDRVKIRGVESCGMLCSGKELNLNDDHSGIMQIDPVIKPGSSLALVLGIPDTVFDLNVGPNRPDCLSVMGLAREYAAKCNQKLAVPKFALKQASTSTIKYLSSKFIAKYACSRYALRYISNITVSPSPWWLQKRLLAGGIRPINSIVDATNYIMLATGQPLHAFDADRVATLNGRKSISVRMAKNSESISLLDGTKKTLTDKIAVIADSKNALAVAGVMGGANSAVTAQTKNIIIESGVFNPKIIRKASQKLGIRTESSNRFEKGVDPAGTAAALDAVASLINDLNGGAVHKGIAIGATVKPIRTTIKYIPEDVNRMLGVNVTAANQIKILKLLGCQIKRAASQITVQVPSWRTDMVQLADIVEEIGRHTGYSKINPKFLTGTIKPVSDRSMLKLSYPIKQRLVELGFSEMINYSFYGVELAGYSGKPYQDHFALSNPLNPEQCYLRMSLVPRLLDNIRNNQSRRDLLKLFEIGTIFQSGGTRPKENSMVTGIVSSKKDSQIEVFLQVKSIIETLMCRSVTFVEPINRPLEYGIADSAAVVRICPPSEAAALKINASTVSFEIPLLELLKTITKKQYVPFSLFPNIQRDISLDVHNSVTFGKIAGEIMRINETTITKEEPQGIIQSVGRIGKSYRDDRTGVEKNNITIRLVFQSNNRTLTSSEVDNLIQQIITRLTTSLGVTIRGDARSK